jgi:hypothetical protein
MNVHGADLQGGASCVCVMTCMQVFGASMAEITPVCQALAAYYEQVSAISISLQDTLYITIRYVIM